jgi:hypothetical protein
VRVNGLRDVCVDDEQMTGGAEIWLEIGEQRTACRIRDRESQDAFPARLRCCRQADTHAVHNT